MPAALIHSHTHPHAITGIAEKGSEHQNENTGERKQAPQTTAKAQHTGTEQQHHFNFSPGTQLYLF
jgi:hypothetical protein